MILRSVRHRGLRRLIMADDPRFIQPDLNDRVRKIIVALILAESSDLFIADAPRGWRVHRLSGDRRNEWSISVTRNWRMIFVEDNGYIDRVNLEDYH